jgi:hypothetical protein
MLSVIRGLRIGSQWLWMLLLAAATARFVWVAAQPILAQPVEPAAAVVAKPVDDVVKTIVPQAPGPAPEPAAPAPVVSDQIHVMLLVGHKQPRSKVLINGAFVGQTTYASDFSCKRGESLAFTIVPARGPKVETVRKCEGQTLVVSE